MSFETLLQFGWRTSFAQHFEPFRAKGYLPGRVSFQNQHLYRVYTTDGELLAEAAGKLRYEAASPEDLPAVGDWVALRLRRHEDKARIQAVLPRRSKFARKTVGTKTEAQIVGANIDTIFLMTSLNQDFNPRRLERYLTTIADSGAQPVLVLNKTDLCHNEAEINAHIAAVHEVAEHVPIHAISAKAQQGVDVLRGYCTEGQTIALIGMSGVGKSTLLNQLLGRERQKVQEVRAHDERGQHTTRHRELILLPTGGLVLDTPGMRELQLWDVESGIDTTFEDITTLATQCFFGDCQHRSEPRCAVLAAVAAGSLEAARLENYTKLHNELHHLVLRQDDYARRNEQKKMRKLMKDAQERARLKRKGS